MTNRLREITYYFYGRYTFVKRSAMFVGFKAADLYYVCGLLYLWDVVTFAGLTQPVLGTLRKISYIY